MASFSQPLLWLPSQFRQLPEQTSSHVPLLHVGVALKVPQRVPHAPQLVTEVFKSASQPLAPLLSQFPQPVSQVSTHLLAVQPAVPWTALHVVPQAPQF